MRLESVKKGEKESAFSISHLRFIVDQIWLNDYLVCSSDVIQADFVFS